MMKLTSRLYQTLPASLVVALLLITSLVPTQQIHAAGNTYYVAKDGSDNNSGTEALPWLTIDHAANTMVAGDTVYVKNGTYTEWVGIEHNSGTAGNLITFKNYPGHSPIIDGVNMTDPGYIRGVVNIGKSYIHVEGFIIRNNPYYQGVVAWGGTAGLSNITLKDLEIYDNALGGICISAWHQANPITNVTIDGCNVHHNFLGGNPDSPDENISLLQVVGFEIKNCLVHDNYEKEGIDAKCGCANGTIHHNEVFNTDDVGIYVDGYDRPQSNIDVYCNKIYDSDTGIAYGCETGEGSQINMNFYNNLIYDNNSSGFAIWAPTGLIEKTFSLINNTFYHNSASQVEIGTPAEYQTDCIIRNNIVVGTDADDVLIGYNDYASGGITIDHNLFYSENHAYHGWNKYGTDYIIADPLLLNPVSDFSIPYSSPAKNSGSPTLAPAFDFTGTARPQGAGYDIGAYEYDSGAPPTNNPPVLDSIGNKTVNAGQLLQFTVSATDPNNDPLTYSASGLPSGASFNGTTRVFTWTPASSQVGTYANVRFAVTDGALTDSENITITVNSSSPGGRADINKDGAVNILDTILIAQHWGQSGASGWIPEDVNNDGTIDILDIILVGQNWTG